MIYDRLEERFRLCLMSISTACRVRLARPIDRRVRRVPGPKHVPVLCVPRIVESLHPLQVVLATHSPPPHTVTPASTTGSDQAQSPNNETAAAPATQPAKKPTTTFKVFLSRSSAPSVKG